MAFLQESLQQHALREILVDLRQLVAAHGKFLANFRRHTLTEEPPDSLDERSPPHPPWHTRPPAQQPVAVPPRCWTLPPSITQPPPGFKAEPLPLLRVDPPRFDGENAQDWIHKIQHYYNNQYMPLHDRLYLTQFLFDHPASEWMTYWEANNKGKGWDDFLLAVRYHFAPKLTEEVDDEEQLGGSSLCASIPDEVLDVDVVSQEFALKLVSDNVPSNVRAPSDGIVLPVASKFVTDSLFVTIPCDEALTLCEFSSHGVDGDDALLAVESAQTDAQYMATPAPCDSDCTESCLEQQNFLGVDDQDLLGFEQKLSSDGRSIPPRNVVTCFTLSIPPSLPLNLDVESSPLDLMHSMTMKMNHCEDLQWGSATLQWDSIILARLAFCIGEHFPWVDARRFLEPWHSLAQLHSANAGIGNSVGDVHRDHDFDPGGSFVAKFVDRNFIVESGIANSILGLAVDFGIAACGDNEKGCLFVDHRSFYNIGLPRSRLIIGPNIQCFGLLDEFDNYTMRPCLSSAVKVQAVDVTKALQESGGVDLCFPIEAEPLLLGYNIDGERVIDGFFSRPWLLNKNQFSLIRFFTTREGMIAYHCGVSKLDEADGVARCLLEFTIGVTGSLKFDSWPPRLFVIIGGGAGLGTGRTWIAAIADICREANAISREFEEVVLNVMLLMIQAHLLAKGSTRAVYNPGKNPSIKTESSINLESADEGLGIHNVFHVSLLKKFMPFISATMDLPASFRRSDPYYSPITAVASRTVLVDGILQEQWSVGWASDAGANPSWESTAMLKKHFPDLHLVDKVALVDGGVDRNPTASDETRPTIEHGEGQMRDEEPTASKKQVGQPNNKPDGKPKGRKKPAQLPKE